MGDFRSVWLEEESEPPAFVRGREKEERERSEREAASEDGENPTSSKGKGKAKGKKRKRKRGDESDEDEETVADVPMSGGHIIGQPEPLIDPTLFNEGILAGTNGEPLFLPEDFSQATLVPTAPPPEPSPTLVPPQPSSGSNPETPAVVDPSPVEASLDAALTEEVSSFLETAKGAQLSEALDDADAQRAAGFIGDQELEGLDEEDLDAFILTEEEVRMKERVWVEMNRDYLENLAGEYINGAEIIIVGMRWLTNGF